MLFIEQEILNTPFIYLVKRPLRAIGSNQTGKFSDNFGDKFWKLLLTVWIFRLNYSFVLQITLNEAKWYLFKMHNLSGKV